MSLWRLEWLRLIRTRRLVALVGTYAFFGFVGPLTARYLSAIIDRFGGGDIQVVVPDPVPVDGIVQFTGNIYPIGLLVTLALYLGLKTLFPEEGEKLYLLFRFIRYALLGLWIGLGAPLVFRLLRLVEIDPVDRTNSNFSV